MKENKNLDEDCSASDGEIVKLGGKAMSPYLRCFWTQQLKTLPSQVFGKQS